jgi:hypothetical protein
MDPPACYEDSFTVLYVGDVCTSQETQVLASAARNWDSFTSSIHSIPDPTQ